MARTGNPASRQVESVTRAVAILDALAAARTDLGTSEVGRMTGINLSTVSRILATLTAGGLVDHVRSTGRYHLGVGLIRLANAARDGLDVRSLARPYLEELAELTGETATLSTPGRHEAVTVDFAQSAMSVRSVAEVGRVSVAHATSVGKVFVAYGGTVPDGPLHRYTDRTIVDPRVLAAETAAVRERGWAEAAGEREHDLNGVAAPILNRAGTLIAILGVQGPSARFGPPEMRTAVGYLLDRAAVISGAV
jgi:DNA-binding IclR family transcriptional regulator